METWKLLSWTAGLLVVWAALVTLLGFDLTPGSIFFAGIFGMIGFYVSAKLVDRMVPDPEEE